MQTEKAKSSHFEKNPDISHLDGLNAPQYIEYVIINA